MSVNGSGGFSWEFWGVRGSIPVPGPTTLRYGGNSPCIELRLGERIVVIDCGSGAINLAQALLKEGRFDADILFTHFHLDHVCGLPFFCIAYAPSAQVRLHAGLTGTPEEFEAAVANLMSPPIFPLNTDELVGSRFCVFHTGDDIDLGIDGATIRTIALNHPGGSTGYRIDYHGKSIAVITDHEQGEPEIDAAVKAFIKDADIMVFDAMFTRSDYPPHVGWGHSTWEDAVEFAEAANVKTPVIFHHAPTRTDDALDRIKREAATVHPGAVVASEGMLLTP